MYHVSAQGVDERMINVHYYYYYKPTVCVDVKQYFNNETLFRTQELCESRGGRPGRQSTKKEDKTHQTAPVCVRGKYGKPRDSWGPGGVGV